MASKDEIKAAGRAMRTATLDGTRLPPVAYWERLAEVGLQAAENARSPISDEQAQYARLKEQCEGFDDPEERCPHNPKECLCYPVRMAVEQRVHGQSQQPK